MAASTCPQFFRVRQRFERPRVEDVPAEVHRQLAALKLQNSLRPGQSVAITAGSRGIANIAVIIQSIVEHLKRLEARPFIVPAMGSHGGGTPQGQREVIESYGITEEFCGCPIRSSMETIVVCHTPEGIPVHFDRQAYEADKVMLCGRIKPHTNFTGPIESGLMKMMLLGLGKHEGAKAYHRAIQAYSFSQIVQSVASQVLAQGKILAGLGIVENGYDETAKIEAMLPQRIEERERELLVLARRWMPRLPFQQVDVLIVDQLGKDISGAGMDTNVVGRKHYHHQAAEDELPKVRRIAVRSLTEATHGNALGIGMAEFCTTRLLEQMDRQATWVNCITSGNVAAGAVPIHFETDREMLTTALSTIGVVEPPQAKVLWIKNTLHLAEVECSAAYLEEAREREDLEIMTEPRPLPFDIAGNLPTFAL